MSALLEVEALETAYGSSQVLFGVSFSIAEGEVVTLLGRNGMGKTTTVRSICGLEKPLRGVIRFDGARINGLPADRIGRAVAEAFAAAGYDAPEWFTALPAAGAGRLA